MRVYKILVDGYEVGEMELTREEVKNLNNDGIIAIEK